jgi:hypothetical protein
VDYYGIRYSQTGQRVWELDEIPMRPGRSDQWRSAHDRRGQVVDTLRSTEPISIGVEYILELHPICG